MSLPSNSGRSAKRFSVRPSLAPAGPRSKPNLKSDNAHAASATNLSDRRNVVPIAMARDLTLPDDVLSQIFEYACQPILDPISNPRWRRQFYPLWLGKICRAWRECAWATSELWTTVILRISTEHAVLQTDLLRDWLGRAKGRPLDVYVEPPTSPSWHPDIRSLLSILTEHSEQWQRVDLYHPFRYENFFRTIPMPGLSLPLLRHSSIHHGENELLAKFEINLKRAPLLQSLSLSNFVLNNLNFSLSLYPTAMRIRCLFLSSSIQIDLNDLLSRFPELRDLTWSKCQCSNQQPTVHDRLETLNVEFGIESSPTTFFCQLSLPALKSLSLRLSKPFQYYSRLEYISPCFQNGCSLNQLTIECQMTAVYEDDLINLLSSQPISSSLTEVHIHNSNFKMGKLHVPERDTRWGLSQSFFDHLYPEAFPDFLPNVEVLEYEGPLMVQFIDFIDPVIIRSGMRAGSCVGPASGTAAITKMKITADQNCTISEHPDAYYVWEIIRMVEEEILVLVNMDGTKWV